MKDLEATRKEIAELGRLAIVESQETAQAMEEFGARFQNQCSGIQLEFEQLADRMFQLSRRFSTLADIRR